MSAPAFSPPVSVAVVVVSYDNVTTLSDCLDSVLAADSPSLRVELVVVDNSSRDGSAALVAERYPEARLIQTGENAGFARACNVGAEASTSEFVLLLNPDAVLRPGALASLVTFAVAHPEHGLYGGRVVEPDGSNDPTSCWGDMTIRSQLCFATGLSTAFARHPVLDPESLGTWARDSVREVPVITGCLLLTRRETWADLRGMDETFWLYGEDSDFSLRARAVGLRPVVVPEAELLHTKGGSSPGGTKMPLVMAGKITLMQRRWRRPARIAGRVLLLSGVGLRALAGRLSGRRDTVWTGVWSTRAQWGRGYPAAKELVGLPPTAPAPVLPSGAIDETRSDS
ncbi:glycosyltransferase family 2 protein [Modestobacter sp. VKM Ac-2977]|uniref:glycosyltransferase family 2 protein n=1 Tax=Modestobacter sp. VKM Ac-2977 TaxID=3004131 RepID=UPI0022AA2321|nr:glycosyltransferase family 2 protein [Modestobacter sp. VKM Ac-2977]MCZ2822757.1 glycosyltransferase family 2 protein [Modestobacter sp. VKM Ac-2977]